MPGTERISVYPNPASEWIKLNVDLNESGILQIYDVNGRLIKQDEIMVPSEVFSVSVHDLARGLAVIEMTAGNKRYVSKVVLK